MLQRQSGTIMILTKIGVTDETVKRIRNLFEDETGISLKIEKKRGHAEIKGMCSVSIVETPAERIEHMSERNGQRRQRLNQHLKARDKVMEICKGDIERAMFIWKENNCTWYNQYQDGKWQCDAFRCARL